MWIPISLFTAKTARQYISLPVLGTEKKPTTNPQQNGETWNNMLIKRSHISKTTYCVFPPIWIPRKGKTIVTERRWMIAWELGGAAKMHKELLGWWKWAQWDHRTAEYLPKTHWIIYLKQVTLIVCKPHCNTAV